MLIDELRATALARSQTTDSDSFVLNGLFRLDLAFRPNPKERLFKHTVVMAQTVGLGCCYTEEEPVLDSAVVGQDARRIRTPFSSVQIATLDAVYSAFPKKPAESHLLNDTAVEKSKRRARIVADEVALQLGSPSTLAGNSVVNIGAVGNIIAELTTRGAKVFATDQDPRVVGSSICDRQVENCEANSRRIDECDLALVTGMSLATNTLDDIMSQCKTSRKKLIIFAETGANFAEEYCRLGADAVISEPFPFYIFSGTSKIDVYRRKQLGG